MEKLRFVPGRQSNHHSVSGGQRRGLVVGGLLLASLVLLCVGLWMPAITVKSLFFDSEYSMIDGILSFFDAQEYFFFAIVGLFSVALPSLKLVVLLAIWAVGESGRSQARTALRVIMALSKWSMLDVFIVAVMVVALDGKLFTTAEVHAGIVLFSASILLSTFAAFHLNRQILYADNLRKDGAEALWPPK